MAELEKATYQNLMTLVSEALKDGYVTDIDPDNKYVYVRQWEGEPDYRSKTYRYSYSLSGVNITINQDSKQEVVGQTQYVEKAKDEFVTKSFLTGFLQDIKELVKGKSQPSVDIIKEFKEEEMISIEPFYVPPSKVDLHGDKLASVEVIKAGVDSFNKAIEEGRAIPCLFHKHKTESFEFVKAWVVEKDTQYGDRVAEAGQPLIEIKWKNEKAWELRKSGRLMGGSMRAKSNDIEEVDDE